MYKILNRLTPDYMYDIMPPLVHRRTTNDMRHRLNITFMQCTTTSFSRSFFPSAIKLWNSLLLRIRNSESVYDFREHLKKGTDLNPKQILYFLYFGDRYLGRIHAQMRMGCCT